MPVPRLDIYFEAKKNPALARKRSLERQQGAKFFLWFLAVVYGGGIIGSIVLIAVKGIPPSVTTVEQSSE